MRNLHRANKKVSSLFFKLLISFLLISILPLSFNFFSYAFFRTNIMNELIDNNSSITNTAAKQYEELFDVIKNLEFTQHFKTVSSELNKSNNGGVVDYLAIADTSKELNSLWMNTSLHMENMIIVLNHIDFAISKTGSSPILNMFNTYYYSDTYSYEFWSDELRSVKGYKIFPSATFANKSAFDQNVGKNLLPIMYIEAARRNTAIITFLDAEKMFNSFYPNTGGRFYILDRNNQVLFDSGTLQNNKEVVELPAMNQAKTYEKIGTDYFFYQKGRSGFTYVNIIPTSHISSQITRLNIILGTILILSLLLCIAASVYISIRLNRPLQKIIESIRELNFTNPPPRTQIKEFNLITEKINDLVSANMVIHKDMNRQNSLLQYYAYSNKLKNIQMDLKEFNAANYIDKPFMLVAFHLLFTSRLERDMTIERDRAANFFKEYINADLTKTYADSLTFQTEHDIILSLIFMDPDKRPIVEGHLQQWKRVFDLDREYCLVSIAVGDIYYNKSKFADAYQRILLLIHNRQPGDDTQILSEIDFKHPPHFDKEDDPSFQANLKMGNTSELYQIIKRKLNYMNRKNASLKQLHEYAADIIRQVYKAAGKDTSYTQEDMKNTMKRQPWDRLITECYTIEQLEQFFERFLDEEVSEIRQKKEEIDPIIHFVTDYISNHIGDDLSLDMLADKLNITGAYLSTYFKEKKKINFSEYLNNLRMEKAKQLLEATDLKVQDIASQVGYYSVNAFIRTFKKHTGIPPGEFRKIKIIE